MPEELARRRFLTRSLFGAAALAAAPEAWSRAASSALLSAPSQVGPASSKRTGSSGAEMRFGLVTYLWGQDWDLPALIANCEESRVLGVELRTTHRHGVERGLDAKERAEVRARFEDSPVELVGLGSNERFCHPDAAALARAMTAAREFLQLSHDTGGSGVKVKPNDFHKGVEEEKTLEQIGRSLRELATAADDLDQEIRVEVHGKCASLPHMTRIAEIADHPRVRLCWNSNQKDLEGAGLDANFAMSRPWFGQTAHIRELNLGDYPYPRLIELLADSEYRGWVLLEARGKPEDRVKALGEQRRIFASLIEKSRATKR